MKALLSYNQAALVSTIHTRRAWPVLNPSHSTVCNAFFALGAAPYPGSLAFAHQPRVFTRGPLYSTRLCQQVEALALRIGYAIIYVGSVPACTTIPMRMGTSRVPFLSSIMIPSLTLYVQVGDQRGLFLALNCPDERQWPQPHDPGRFPRGLLLAAP